MSVIALHDVRIALENERRRSDTYVELRPLLDRLGVVLIERDLPEGQSGYAIYNESFSRSGFMIVVNKRDPIRRRRFTAAHELGHCVLHPDYVKNKSSGDFLEIAERRVEPTYCDVLGEFIYDPIEDDDVKKLESEADCFASELLVPSVRLGAVLRSGVWRHAEVANYFGVSTAVIVRRTKEIKLKIDCYRLFS